MHDAFEMIVCFAESYFVSFTPRTIVMSSPLAGAEMMTFFAPPSMCLRAASAFGEASGGLEHDVDAEILPRQRRRVLLGEDSDLVAVDGDRAVSCLDVALVRAVNRVVLEQVRERLRIREIVHGDEVDVRDTLLLRGAKHLTSDSSEAVDADANSHSVLSPVRLAPVAECGRPAEGHEAHRCERRRRRARRRTR